MEYFVGLTEHMQEDTIGNEIGGTPALQLPDDKGRSGGGEQPGRWSPGGWRSEGGSRYFSSSKPGGIENFQFYKQHLIWLPADSFSETNTGS